MTLVAQRTILRRHTGNYDFCEACGFLRVRDPHWLEEAYTHAICAADTGAVARNLVIADWLSPLCRSLDNGRGPYLDYGGGHGLLVRLMRDRGYDFRWADRHAENYLARGFEWDAGSTAAFVSAFEVLEHTTDPMNFVQEAMEAANSRTLIFTTELFTGDPPGDDWWYYAPGEGQHIAFFRADTLQIMAQRLGLRFVSDGRRHLLTDRAITVRQLQLATALPSRIVSRLRDRRKGLVQRDHQAMLQQINRDD